MVFCTSCGFEVTNESAKFCPKCGTTTFQDSEKTDSVANHTSNNSSIISTERSKLWYLLPIGFAIMGGVFAIVGGLIAYLVLRKSDSKKAKYCLIIGVVLTLIGLFFMSAIDFFPDDNALESNPSKYDGLTENQILKVKIIEESCASKTFEVEMMAGETQAKFYAQKCAGSVSNMIEGYKNQNNP